MGRRSLLAVAVWLAAAVAAMLTGLAAVQVIGDGITSRTGAPRRPQEVAEALASAASAAPGPGPVPGGTGPGAGPSAAPSGTGVPEPTGGGTPGSTGNPPDPTATGPAEPSGTVRTLRSPGGTVVARCAAGQVELLSWTPEQGYAAREADRGPTREAEVKFEGSRGRVEVKVVCVADTPSATWEFDD